MRADKLVKTENWRYVIMARKYDVTRNFDIYNAKCVLFNEDTEETKKVNVTMDTKDVSKKMLESFVKDKYGKNNILVKFEVSAIGSVMYGMTSADFMKYGVRLNPENRQPLLSTENEDDPFEDSDEKENETQDGTENDNDTENDTESENSTQE